MKKKKYPNPSELITSLSNTPTRENILAIHEGIFQYYLTFKPQKKSDISPLKTAINYFMQYLIECDKTSNTDLCEFFCEVSIMDDIIELSKLSNYEITYQIIESLSFLLLNISNVFVIKDYLYSNNHINNIISIENLQIYDDEFLSLYVNFLKSLSLRIDKSCIIFFFNQGCFPLFNYAVKLYNYSNALITTAVHTVILALLKIDYEPLKYYFAKLPNSLYFINLIIHLRDVVNEFLDCDMIKNRNKQSEFFEDIVDELLYINDILNIENKVINYILLNSLFYYLILPIFGHMLIDEGNPHREGVIIGKEFDNVIIVLMAFFYNIKNKTFQNTLFYMFFSYNISKKISNFFNPKKVYENKFYCSNWEKQCKLKIKFQEFVIINYSNTFFNNLKYQGFYTYEENIYRELSEIKGKIRQLLTEKRYKNETAIKTDIVEQMIFRYFSNTQFKFLDEFHKNCSIISGIKLGNYNENRNDEIISTMDGCFFQLFHEFIYNEYTKKDHIKEDKDKIYYINNDIRDSIIKYLLMDTQINFISDTSVKFFNFFLWMMYNKSNVNKDLLCYLNLIENEYNEYDNDNDSRKNEYKKCNEIDFKFDDNVCSALFKGKNNNVDLKERNNIKLIDYLLDLLVNGNEYSYLSTELICLNINNIFKYNKKNKEVNNLIKEKVENTIGTIYNLLMENDEIENIIDNKKYKLFNSLYYNNLISFSYKINNDKIFDKTLRKIHTFLIEKNKISIKNNYIISFIYLKNILIENKEILLFNTLYNINDYKNNDKYHLFLLSSNKNVILINNVFVYICKIIKDIYFIIENIYLINEVTIRKEEKKENKKIQIVIECKSESELYKNIFNNNSSVTLFIDENEDNNLIIDKLIVSFHKTQDENKENNTNIWEQLCEY